MSYLKILTASVLAAALAATTAIAYPLDLYEQSGISRLKAYYLASQGPMKGKFLYPGALRPGADVKLRLADQPDFKIPAADAEFSAQLGKLLDGDAKSYGIAVLDLSDPANPALAAHNIDKTQNPGSVGKILVALGFLQTLADIYPDDIAARRRVLHDAQITANEFIVHDEHVVPMWKEGDRTVTKRPLQQGDRASVWTYLDWMCSASSNAGASMMMSHMVLLKHFGAMYPVPEDVAAEYFKATSKKDLTNTYFSAIQPPITRNGLDINRLRQGSFFTRAGKSLVPGTYSYSTPRELLKFMVFMEQGKLIDPFSSLELKRLLYLTDRRIRYASSPVLASSAIYFKSGSLYSCRAEPGFVCEKYHGNVKNYMNSVATVETFDRNPQLHYITILLSNVLKKNGAVEHQTLATRIHRLIESRHPVAIPLTLD